MHAQYKLGQNSPELSARRRAASSCNVFAIATFSSLKLFYSNNSKYKIVFVVKAISEYETKKEEEEEEDSIILFVLAVDKTGNAFRPNSLCFSCESRDISAQKKTPDRYSGDKVVHR